MTVNYTFVCATTKFGTFAKLLLRWKGSLYKAVYKELLMFLALYYTVFFTYRYALDNDQKKTFEDFARFCEQNSMSIPLTFVLGFYVNLVVNRWWDQYKNIPLIDRFAMHVTTFVEQDDERGKLLRRTLVRYVNLANVLCLRTISTAVHKRFPKENNLVEAGLMTDEELDLYKAVPDSNKPKFWVPLQWATTLLYKMKKEERIPSESLMYNMVKEVLDFRTALFMLFNYDWISVVTLAVYSYFATCVIGRQYLDVGKNYKGYEFDAYFPIFTVIQFGFYVGWLKVAETLMNPFGEDDDDFEINFLLSRNVQVGFSQVTDQFNVLPSLEKDTHWNEVVCELPHTAASLCLKDSGFDGSASAVKMSRKAAITIPPDRQKSTELKSSGSVRSKRDPLGSNPVLNGSGRFMLATIPSVNEDEKTAVYTSCPTADDGDSLDSEGQKKVRRRKSALRTFIQGWGKKISRTPSSTSSGPRLAQIVAKVSRQESHRGKSSPTPPGQISPTLTGHPLLKQETIDLIDMPSTSGGDSLGKRAALAVLDRISEDNSLEDADVETNPMPTETKKKGEREASVGSIPSYKCQESIDRG